MYAELSLRRLNVSGGMFSLVPPSYTSSFEFRYFYNCLTQIISVLFKVKKKKKKQKERTKWLSAEISFANNKWVGGWVGGGGGGGGGRGGGGTYVMVKVKKTMDFCENGLFKSIGRFY